MKQSFSSENQLVHLFERVAPLLDRGFNSILELDSSNGIADVAFYKLRKDWESNSNLGHIHPRWAYALSQLPYRKQFTTEDFSILSGVSKGTALNILKSYVAAGYCEFSDTNKTWSKNKQPVLIANKVYAIEAKLKDWKKALKQAYRYKDYANKTWVVMDEKHVNPAARNVDAFKKLDVGLASISVNGNIRRIWSPQEATPRHPISQWYANAVIAKQLSVKK